MQAFPAIGDEKQTLHITSYNEFHMTNDADLFRFDGVGWPLYQGGKIHHYNAYFDSIERTVVQSEGEARLAKKRRKQVTELRDRTYRLAWRDVAQPTDLRSLIATILPRGVFAGNTLNLAEIVLDSSPTLESEIISGINVIFSSFIADFFIRQRISRHVNAFILKSLPVPRDVEAIRELGRLALPLYCGEEFEAFRGGLEQLDDERQRLKLIAQLDARTARLYELSYEEYQAVLGFPLVAEEQKKHCLLAFKELLFGEI